MNRKELGDKAMEVGRDVNELREALLAAGAVFTAGIVRGAEESILVVLQKLSDASVPEDEL